MGLDRALPASLRKEWAIPFVGLFHTLISPPPHYKPINLFFHDNSLIDSKKRKIFKDVITKTNATLAHYIGFYTMFGCT